MNRSTINLHLGDSLEAMKGMEDNAYELAIVDVPYGINMSGGVTYQRPSRPNSYGKTPKHTRKEWDNSPPTKEYFNQLFRVSKNQIIWGANYLTQHLPASMGWVYWGKMEDDSDFSDGELAYTSFERALKRFKCHQFHGTHGGKDRIHPTQKPVKLYEWLLHNYANEGDKILDTHSGSLSIAIACAELGFDLDAYELDADYFEAAHKRLVQHASQLNAFQLQPIINTFK